jgi:uncharacterized protein YndB with AHSA1/START domain
MKDYKKYYSIPEEPDIVYAALTNQHTLEAWTGGTAEMSGEEGSEFSLWDGSIVGKNISFEPGKKIVQQWYFDGQEEPSIVTIILHPHKQGTSAELRHTNIPDEVYDEFVEGWDQSYFGALIDFYSE